MDNALAGHAVAQDDDVRRADLPFEYMLNALRLRGGFALTDFTERTACRSALLPALDAAQSKGLIVREGGHAPTERALTFERPARAVLPTLSAALQAARQPQRHGRDAAIVVHHQVQALRVVFFVIIWPGATPAPWAPDCTRAASITLAVLSLPTNDCAGAALHRPPTGLACWCLTRQHLDWRSAARQIPAATEVPARGFQRVFHAKALV